MRKLIFAVALLLALFFLFARWAEMQAIAETLQRGDWRFMLLALGIQAVWLLNVAAVYRLIYRALGMEEKIERLALLASAANFINVVAPSIGMGGMAVFISDARRRGYPAGRATVANVLFVVFDYAGFFCVLALGLVVLFRRGNLITAEIAASAFLFAIALGLAALLFLGMRSAHALGQVLAALAHGVNWLLRPFRKAPYLSEARAHAFAHDAADGLRLLRRTPANFYLPLALTVSSKALLVLVLSLIFLAFKVPISVGTLIAAFSLAYLFLIVSPTPAGIGVVEGVLTLALTSFYIPLGAAAVLSLAYRGVTFWIPLLVGLVSFRVVSHAPA